jgi:lipid-binding SYLF domain-containing protein
VVKAGFIFSAKGGQGVVVARTRRGWSGPSFIATGGGGWGLQAGAQVTDFVIVLNNDAAVQAFSRGGNVTIGMDVSAAAGPVGRTAAGAVTPTAAVYTYSRSKGLFVGVSLEGAVIGTQRQSNFNYYGGPVQGRFDFEWDYEGTTGRYPIASRAWSLNIERSNAWQGIAQLPMP